MIVTIHQPEFMPYLGFFHKMSLSDKFVLLDNVQFKKNNFQNRNKININANATWLTLPIKSHPLNTKILDIEINHDIFDIAKKHTNSIKQNYSKTPFFNDLYPFIEKLYKAEYKFLVDFNTQFILYLKQKLKIETDILKASELELSGKAKGGTEVTLEISKILNAKTYISGAGGKSYMNSSLFDNENIKIHFQNYHHPIYKQQKTEEFIPYLSIIDLYFNYGHKSLEIIMKNNISKI